LARPGMQADAAFHVDEALRQALDKRRGSAKGKHFASKTLFSQWRKGKISSNIKQLPR
jgi:hypothetical protein